MYGFVEERYVMKIGLQAYLHGSIVAVDFYQKAFGTTLGITNGIRMAHLCMPNFTWTENCFSP